MSSPSFSSHEILESARTIRAYLPKLLTPDEAQQMDAQLSDLLAQAHTGQAVEQQILSVLTSHSRTQEWVAEFLSPTTFSRGPGDSVLPGRIGMITAPRYVCPEGDFVWYRFSLGETIPTCPSHPHLGPLVLKEPTRGG